MSDERLLRALGQLAREQAAVPVPSELVTPPDPAVKDRIVTRGLADLAAHAPVTEAAGITPITAARKAGVGRRRWLAGAGGSLALAACALLWASRQQGEGTSAALPAYSLSLAGGIAEQRSAGGAGAAPLVLESGARVEVLLRPASATGEDLGARFFWVKDGRIRLWAITPERSPEGALRATGRPAAPFGAGAGELVAVVARQGALPDGLTTQQLASPPRGWQLLRHPVRWR